MKARLVFIPTFLFALIASGSPPENPMLSLLRDRDALRDIPFSRVVELTTGHRILPMDPRQHAALLSSLAGALDATLRTLNDPAHPIHTAGRVNEASRFVEDEIRRQVNQIPGWKCRVPLTAKGHEQRSGYPDLRIETIDGVVFYLDPKLYTAAGRASSLRTFYYEPKTLTGKIHDDAMHLLVGIEHAGADARHLRLQSWQLVDLSRLKVQLKAEFQASNRDVYQSKSVILQSSPSRPAKD